MKINTADIGVNIPTEKLIEIFRDPLVAPDKRWGACLALGLKADQASFEFLKGLLQAEDPDVRRVAAEAIENHSLVHQVEDELIKLLSDKNIQVIRTACQVLGAIKSEKAHDAIVNLISSKNGELQVAAIRALSTMWRPNDFAVIFTLFKYTPLPAVKNEAAWALVHHADETNWKNLFSLWCVDPLERHRLWSCQLAKKFGKADIMPLLIKLSTDKSSQVRKAAKDTLKYIEKTNV